MEMPVFQIATADMSIFGVGSEKIKKSIYHNIVTHYFTFLEAVSTQQQQYINNNFHTEALNAYYEFFATFNK